MKKSTYLAPTIRMCCILLGAGTSHAQITNAGFEGGWQGWTDSDPSGTDTALSDVANSGAKAVKLSGKSSYVSQVVNVKPNTAYRLSAFARGPGNIGVKVGTEIFFEQQPKKSKKWQQVAVTFNSGEFSQAYIFCSAAGSEVRFDDFELATVAEAEVETSARIISSRAGGYGLSPDLPPGRNFDLLDWYLNTPDDKNNDGISDRITEVELARGWTDKRLFYTAADGGMVFRATVAGAKTSKNTRFTRTELREMLRRGDTKVNTKNDNGTPNKNNWALSSAPEKAQKAAGGVDGTLRATVAVNHVTTTGDPSQVGRVIIGQIHAKKDEPIRLYYRKLPGNTRGAIYAAHEPPEGDDIYVELIGSRANSAPDSADGIGLDEVFSYVIETRGNQLHVSISQNGAERAREIIDMTGSGYDAADEYMYFKAGVYNQNNSGDADDYVQATFYELENSHSGYTH